MFQLSAPPSSIRVQSAPYTNRIGLVPMIITLCTGWIFVCIWGAFALFTLSHNIYWALVLSGSTTAFAGFLLYTTYTMVADSFTQYTFEMTGSEAVLTSHNRVQHCSKVLMVMLDDIKFVEYYPYRDSSCLIMHAPYCEMEVPLWSMGNRGQDILDFLTGRGVRVVNVQSDDCIPPG